MIKEKPKKQQLRLVSARIPIDDYKAITEKLNGITTLSDAIKQLIKNYIKD